MDQSELTLENWQELIAELGDIDEFTHFVDDQRSKALLDALLDLQSRLAERQLPDPDQTICDLALLRKAYTHKQSLSRLKAS